MLHADSIIFAAQGNYDFMWNLKTHCKTHRVFFRLSSNYPVPCLSILSAALIQVKYHNLHKGSHCLRSSITPALSRNTLHAKWCHYGIVLSQWTCVYWSNACCHLFLTHYLLLILLHCYTKEIYTAKHCFLIFNCLFLFHFLLLSSIASATVPELVYHWWYTCCNYHPFTRLPLNSLSICCRAEVTPWTTSQGTESVTNLQESSLWQPKVWGQRQWCGRLHVIFPDERDRSVAVIVCSRYDRSGPVDQSP